jgi:hypothetical protein
MGFSICGKECLVCSQRVIVLILKTAIKALVLDKNA